ncbi:excinuclease ABC subunit A [Paraglaciecola aquimarina]|uniref:Excinuclease ABC subunit A n=1 Tax=Paraglaciecola aquimarina TaxID=1235557 RepID=A0ABU3SSS1_9ALTE|nr:excinuclease ABC subunit A [Paraglaciecola aquimarina]MDU0353034.1 excinuclease ABC subunit A [Paraglaciecola aquimarina]
MKITLVCLVSCLFLSMNAAARDDRLKFPIEPLLSSEKAKQALLDIPIYFAGQPHATPVKTYGEMSTNKKTNAFNKSDQEACEWVLLSALKALQEGALKKGMNAVVDIKSNYKHNEFVSSTEFECGAGTFLSGVALKGTAVTLP